MGGSMVVKMVVLGILGFFIFILFLAMIFG